MQRSSYLTGSVHVPVFQNLGSLKAAPRAARGCSMQTSNIKVVSLPTVARTLRLPACPFRIGIVVGDIESEGKWPQVGNQFLFPIHPVCPAYPFCIGTVVEELSPKAKWPHFGNHFLDCLGSKQRKKSKTQAANFFGCCVYSVSCGDDSGNPGSRFRCRCCRPSAFFPRFRVRLVHREYLLIEHLQVPRHKSLAADSLGQKDKGFALESSTSSPSQEEYVFWFVVGFWDWPWV